MATYNYENKRVIFDNGEGGVSILVPSPNCELSLEQIIDKDIPVDRSKDTLEASDLPTDRTYRNAWTKGDRQVGINVEKAKALHKDKIRAVRDPLLEAEDVNYMRADEAGNNSEKQAVRARKQALRDVTNIVDTATITATDVNGVTAELKAVWDADVLGDNPL
jgi:hypothetical protein